VLFAILGLVVAVLFMDLFFFHRLRELGRSVVEAAYLGSAFSPIQAVFNRVATDAYKTSLEAYLGKYDDFYAGLTTAVLVLICLALFAVFSLTFPTLPERSGLSRRLAGWPAWLGSAVVLGFTVSMRPVGAFAGFLVSLEAVRVGRAKAVLPLVAFWFVASVATVATWPYLWPNPILRLMDSFRLAAEFSVHSTLFRGLRFGSGNLPWDYFPTLTALQLTETAVLLMLLGLSAIAWRAVRREKQRRLIGLILLWVGVPLIVLIGLKTSGYEFRHFLFMLPPLLLVAGIGLELIGERVRGWARALLFVVVIAPGLVGIAQLHPYEHIYFNTFAGGVSGADGLYQLDRECLSYREATAFVNRIARPGAVVVVPQQTNQVLPFARGDLVIRDISRGLAEADFILSCIWRDQYDFPTTGFARVYEVRRGTAVLTEVWQREEQQQ
jgi:hypothetical protein